jgi:DNA-binding XRE family transcriptional regulator
MKTHLIDGRKVAELRKIIGKSQSQFAAMIGVSIHTIISVENGRNQLSENLTRRIKIATGADLSRQSKGKIAAVGGGGYTRKDFEEWHTRFSSEEHSAKERFEEIKYWVELVFRAAAKPGVAGNRDRLPAVYLSLVDWLHDTRQAFKLEREIDDILEDDTHEISNIILSYECIKNDKQLTELASRQLGMKPEEILKLFKQEMRSMKRQDRVFMQLFSEVRKAWNPDRGQIGHATDDCKVKKILPKAEFEFIKFIHSRTNPVREQFFEYFRDKGETATPPDSLGSPTQS